MEVREGYYSEQIRDEALQSILDTLGERQKAVYDIIAKWQPISNERIAEHLGVYPHQVTPRTLELRELGLVEFAGDSVSSISNRKISLWKINPDGKQLSLFS
jgi:predicted transcriptional regulator